jgi:hypothetical protein
VLLKLQPYAQSLVVKTFSQTGFQIFWDFKPFRKLAFKYFGPYEVIEKIGSVVYKLQLPSSSFVHPVFHVSKLKAFTPNHSPVYSSLLDVPALDVLEVALDKVINRQLVKKGNVAITQVLVQWSDLPESSSIWEDYNLL